jgi:pimeloyl-ACP methyl ester carboxylesterase
MTFSKPLNAFFNRSTFVAAALLTGVLMTTTQSAQAADGVPAGVHNIVLVHGAWADGSSWSKIIAPLEAKGYHVVAVQNPLTSLADDTATTKRAIALMDGPVLLVGHSYGGAVITEAGSDPKVAGLLLLTVV